MQQHSLLFFTRTIADPLTRSLHLPLQSSNDRGGHDRTLINLCCSGCGAPKEIEWRTSIVVLLVGRLSVCGSNLQSFDSSLLSSGQYRPGSPKSITAAAVTLLIVVSLDTCTSFGECRLGQTTTMEDQEWGVPDNCVNWQFQFKKLKH